jgi:two-component system phosphate regulon response regulator OmpR
MPTPARKILLVDDDARLRALLTRYLDEHGFYVKAVADASAMDRALLRERFDLMVLDHMLPGEDGLAICRRLRQSEGDVQTLPILMLTARGHDEARIEGLEAGADDYLPKPFNPRELLARIEAILRRAPAAPLLSAGVIHFGPNAVNLATRELTREGVAVGLTSNEFALLKLLLENPRQPMSRDKLSELARGREYDVNDRAIDVQISKLRKLLEPNPAEPRYLQTVWGLGYMFVPDEPAPPA